jgi:hypothetical protein
MLDSLPRIRGNIPEELIVPEERRLLVETIPFLLNGAILTHRSKSM